MNCREFRFPIDPESLGSDVVLPPKSQGPLDRASVKRLFTNFWRRLQFRSGKALAESMKGFEPVSMIVAEGTVYFRFNRGDANDYRPGENLYLRPPLPDGRKRIAHNLSSQSLPHVKELVELLHGFGGMSEAVPFRRGNLAVGEHPEWLTDHPYQFQFGDAPWYPEWRESLVLLHTVDGDLVLCGPPGIALVETKTQELHLGWRTLSAFVNSFLDCRRHHAGPFCWRLAKPKKRQAKVVGSSAEATRA